MYTQYYVISLLLHVSTYNFAIIIREATHIILKLAKI